MDDESPETDRAERIDRTQIFVVDDDDDIRELMTMVLRARGYAVESEGDGSRALEYLHTHAPPDVLLLDLRMPHMAGDDVVSALRGDPAFRDLPIVILSGDSNACRRASELAVQGCLLKPVDLHDLLATVRRFTQAA